MAAKPTPTKEHATQFAQSLYRAMHHAEHCRKCLAPVIRHGETVGTGYLGEACERGKQLILELTGISVILTGWDGELAS